MLIQKDLDLLQKKGISLQEVEEQQRRIQRGSTPLAITKAATKGQGILQLEAHQVESLRQQWSREKSRWSFEKFVPASGAATRMFKDLYTHLQEGVENQGSREFLQRLRDFPFYSELRSTLDSWDAKQALDSIKILEYLLQGEPAWGSKPKGVLPFHRSAPHCRTAMGEQLSEGRGYAEKEGKVAIHFTISPDHKELFQQTEKREIQSIGKGQFQISYSFQKPSTDTVALDASGDLFRTEQGELLFRPGGHGALIFNLDEQPADILFIKNIDNVQQQSLQEPTIAYFQALAGQLIAIRTKQEQCYEQLKKDPSSAAQLMPQVQELCGLRFPDGMPSLGAEDLMALLDRPLRICGMVKNQGEPGGGPFWVKDSRGYETLQILESAQIDLRDSKNREIFNSSTHFNPVFMVCLKRDFSGKAYSLLDFVDQDSYFIAHKTLDGRELKALELPGLWNGAMANWSTGFVEIPGECFTPVKTVNDLLRRAHR